MQLAHTRKKISDFVVRAQILHGTVGIWAAGKDPVGCFSAACQRDRCARLLL